MHISTPAPPAELVATLRAASRIVVLTGAGMSVESGIPTFRDPLAGLWSRFDPEALATREGFERDPALVWGWYASRRQSVSKCMPNAGHVSLRDLAKLDWVEDLAIVTQNVDDLHERAGSAQVIHLHGSLFKSRCLLCGRTALPSRSNTVDPVPVNADGSAVPPPHCKHCNGYIRPGVVWFGEELPTREWSLAVKRVQQADLVLVVGTSRRVYPAASLSEIAKKKGIDVWVIDPDEGIATGSKEVWRATAATALPELVRACGMESLSQ